MTKVLNLAILVSCTKSSTAGATIADWLRDFANDLDNFEVERLDLVEWELPPTPTLTPSPAVREVADDLSARIEGADAFVIVTPEYNHSFPALLKIVIDWNYTQWRTKPVAFVSYGGRGGGIRAAEQLRQVFAELHAVSLRDGMSFHGPSDYQELTNEPGDATSAHIAAKAMFEQLSWWGHALAEAREKHPYNV